MGIAQCSLMAGSARPAKRWLQLNVYTKSQVGWALPTIAMVGIAALWASTERG